MLRPEEGGQRVEPGRGEFELPSDLIQLDQLPGYQIAEHEIDPRGWKVFDVDGEDVGTIRTLLVSPSTHQAYFAVVETGTIFNKRRILLPLEEMDFEEQNQCASVPYTASEMRNIPEWDERNPRISEHAAYWSGLGVTSRAAFTEEAPTVGAQTSVRGAGMPPVQEEMAIPVVEEEAEVRKVARETGFVTIRKRAETETQHISEPVRHTRVYAEKRDVAPGEVQAEAEARGVTEGEVVRIPIVEEELVVEKRPRVTEEVVVRTEMEAEPEEREVELRREEVEIDRSREPGQEERERFRRAA